MPHNSQANLTVEMGKLRAELNLLSDDAEKLLMYATEVLTHSVCICSDEYPENRPCGVCMLRRQVQKMVRPGSPLAATFFIKGDLSHA